MPNAFTHGRARLDPLPYAPGSGGKTPLELATERGLLDCWISTGRPNTAAGRRVAAGATIQAERQPAIEPHEWIRGEHGCRDCPLPERHRVHITAPTTHDAELRRIGERKDTAA